MDIREFGRMKTASGSPRERRRMPARLLVAALSVAAASCIPGGPPDCPEAGLREPLKELGHAELPALLAHVAYSPQVCAGEPVEVKVEAAAADEAVDIYVQGRPGTHQWLQLFGTAGPRQVQVYAHTASGKSEFVELPLEVVDCEATWPRLQLALDAEHDRMVDFVVANAQELGEGLSYHWTFGDGAEVDTDVPAVRHTYAIDAIDWHSPDTAFQASVEAVGVCPQAVARKTVVYHHEYARMLKGGIVQPPLEYDVAGHTGDYTIHNVEAEALVLDHATSTWQPCLPGGELREGPSGAASVEVEGHGVYAGHIDLSGAPEDACGMELRLTGVLKGHSELRVDVPLYFEVKESTSRIQRVRDPGVIHMLEQADAAGLLPPGGTSVGDLQEYAREGRFEFVYPTPPIDEGADPAPGSVVPLAGELRCNAHDTAPPPGLVPSTYECRPTGEYEVLTSYVANAHAGDIALSAGCGLVGALLRNVTPAQHYSHTGIFTRDFDSIRNSTASESWLEDDSDGVDHLPGPGADGFRDKFLRHMWPGMISESADEAWYGHLLRSDHPDDEVPQLYELHTFNTNPVSCEGDGDSQTWPRLIRPLPIGLGNTPAQADINRRDARATAGRVAWMGGHYRLFAYTDGSIGTNERYDWPEGPRGRDLKNRGLVCSSTIWTGTRDDNHFDMLGPIPVDRESGSPCGLEGLYDYDARERGAGAHLVHERVYQAALDGHPVAGIALDAADDVADQVTNCFVSDACQNVDGDDHNEWQNPGTGCAVSPDDLMRWTETWGYQEPIAFRHAQVRPVYAWQSPQHGQGEVRVTVVNQAGEPIEGAEVSLGVDELPDSATARTALSDAEGHVLFENAPGGHQVAQAWAWFPAPGPDAPQIVATGFTGFDLADGEHAEVVVELDESDQAGVLQRQQRLHITYDATVIDDEWFGTESNAEHADRYVTLDGYHPRDEVTFSTCAGHEAEIRVRVTLTLKDSGNVDTQAFAEFFEGTSCDTNDREDRWASDVVTVADAEEQSVSQVLTNDGVFGGDSAWLDISIKNEHRYAP